MGIAFKKIVLADFMNQKDLWDNFLAFCTKICKKQKNS